MKKLLLALTLMIMVGTASATNLQIAGDLTAEQKASLILQAEQMASQQSPARAQEVRKWVEVGNAVGEGLASAAGKLGVEANKFATTDVGKFTMFVIAWSYFGSEVIQIMFGLMILMFGVPTWVWLWVTRGQRVMDSETKYEKGESSGGKSYHANYKETTDVVQGWYLGVLIIILILATLMIILA